MSSALAPVEVEQRRAWVENRLYPALCVEAAKCWEPGIEDTALLDVEVEPAVALLHVAVALYLDGETGRETVRIASRRVVHSWWVAAARYRVEVLGWPRGRGVADYMAERRAALYGPEQEA